MLKENNYRFVAEPNITMLMCLLACFIFELKLGLAFVLYESNLSELRNLSPILSSSCLELFLIIIWLIK